MTVEELIGMLSVVEDKTMAVVFPIGEAAFASPCPYECGIVTLGPTGPVIDEQGEYIPGEDEQEWSEETAQRVYFLMPHNPDNPHD